MTLFESIPYIVAAFYYVGELGLAHGLVAWMVFSIILFASMHVLGRTIWLLENWLRALFGMDKNPW